MKLVEKINNFLAGKKKIKAIMDLDAIYAQYGELKNSPELLTLDNFSIDFVVQNSSDMRTFKMGISNFHKSFAQRGNFEILGEFVTQKKILKSKVPTIVKEPNRNSINATFFTDERLNAWMFNEIEDKLQRRFPIEINEEMILYKDNNGVLKVLFNDQLLKGV